MNTATIVALVLCVLVILIGALVLWARRPGRVHARHHRRIVLHIYRHVDEILGAKSFEKQRAATMRHLFSFLLWFVPFLGWTVKSRRGLLAVALVIWPATRADGTVPWPPHRRRVKYVRDIEFGIWQDGRLLPIPAGEPLRVWHVHSVTLGWSSEGVANAKEFFEHLERGKASLGSGGGSAGLAQALGLQWTDTLFTRAPDFATACVKLTRTRALAVPDVIDAAEDLA